METGENIKKLRKSKGMTQKQLGDLCGIADSAIRRYENGGANPKLETIRKIAAALECDISDLIDVYAIDELDSPAERQIEEDLVPVLKKLGYKINGRVINGLGNNLICKFSVSRDGEEKEVSSRELYKIKKQTEEALADAQRALFLVKVEEFIESIESNSE